MNIMKILLIEDQLYKSDPIIEYVKMNHRDVEINLARSYSDGIQEIMTNKYDMILLDMTLPIFEKKDGEDGGTMFDDGGRRIIRRMKSKKLFIPCFVITQYDKIMDVTIESMNDELFELAPEIYQGYIFYQSNSNVWKTELSNKIGYVKDTIN